MNYFTTAAQCCVNSYNGKHGTVDWSNITDVENFSVNDVQGFFATWDKYRIICFQGSQGTADWVDNYKFLPVKINSSASVHAGFLSQYFRVSHIIVMVMSTHNRLLICGHSLGGAIATICAYKIKEISKYHSVTCVTLGSPRVGDKIFCEKFNAVVDSSYRFVLDNDIVCKVPFPGLLEYGHVSTKIHLKTKKGMKHLHEKIIGSRNDHRPEKYLKTIRERYG